MSNMPSQFWGSLCDDAFPDLTGRYRRRRPDRGAANKWGQALDSPNSESKCSRYSYQAYFVLKLTIFNVE